MTEIREMYEYGRSEGYAEGERDVATDGGLGTIHEAVSALEPELRHARDAVQVARSGFKDLPTTKRYRAFIVGRARGYREAVGVGG